MAGISSSMIDGAGLPFKEALEFWDYRLTIPTKEWGEIWDAAYAHAFTVAGATSEGLLNDFRTAIRKALSEGSTLQEFRKSFDEIVAKHGWDYHGTAGWRSRLIYETNLNMAYAAGRYKQMTDPDVAAVFPYWTYRHSGNPHPRLQHKAWDGLTLDMKDSFWSTNYPPNGFNCGCWVEPQMQSDLKRMGKKGPDASPELQTIDVVNKRTGEVHKTTKGVDAGFNYNVGEAWLKGKDKALAKDLPSKFKATPVAPPAPVLPRDMAAADKIWAEHSQEREAIQNLSNKLDVFYGEWSASLSRTEASTLSFYKASGYRRINEFLRGEKVADGVKKLAKTIDSALRTAPGLPHDLVLYRGVEAIDAMAKAKPGKTQRYRAFMSSSISEDSATQFKNRAQNGKMVVIRAPKGYKGIAYVHSVPKVQLTEYEFLARPGALYKVISNDGDTIIIELLDEGPRRARLTPPKAVDRNREK